MLVDIFSSFDDGNEVIWGFSFLMWSVAGVFLGWVFNRYWWAPGRSSQSVQLLSSFPVELVRRSRGNSLGGFLGFVVALFYLLVCVNLLGLLPYVFSLSSHLVFTFSLAVPLWISVILASFAFNPVGFLSHFCPLGAPLVLSPFLALIEWVSISVRPITLGVRLAANMSAGHIVLGLLGICFSSVAFTSSSVLILVAFLGLGYFLFEVGVCLIQAYIFSLLATLYADEHA